jgi:hypothetical protein
VARDRQDNLLERLGAALAAPGRALALAETPAGSGHAPADLALLLLAGFAATHVVALTRAGWLAVDGSAMDAVRMVLSDLSAALFAPILFVLVGGVAVTVLAGHRRAPAADFDLACVAAVPLAAVAALVELGARAGMTSWSLKQSGSALSYLWGTVLLALAVRQARRRSPPSAAAPAAGGEDREVPE